MDYYAWSENYRNDAKKIKKVIDRKKGRLKGATREERKRLSDEIIAYRVIYYELNRCARILKDRAKRLEGFSDAA